MRTALFFLLTLAFPALMHSQNKAIDFDVNPENSYIVSQTEQTVDFLVKVKGNKSEQEYQRTPLNISLVIDHSGSMAGEKLEYVKKACNLVLDNLSSEDIVSIVIYDSNVHILERSSYLKNKNMLKDRINNISSGSSTNLSGGLIEGFKQVKSTFDRNKVNRVLLLSDGLANQGITDLKKLQELVKSKYLEDGIALSTFGVGADFNEELMTSIADHGNGNYYFIDSPDNIPHIFKEELEGLLSVVAQNTILEFDYPSSYVTIDRSYGYDIKKKNGRSYIDFNDVFSEEEKIVLLRFRKLREINRNLNFKFTLAYDDVQKNNKRVIEEREFELIFTQDPIVYKNSYNKDVVKYKVIFLSNEQFDKAAKMADKGQYEDASKQIDKTLKEMKSTLKKYDIEVDEYLEEQMTGQMEYKTVINDMENMSTQEIKMQQKAQKFMNNNVYKNKRK